MTVLMQDILAAALTRPAVDGTRIIGVDGPSGSGKSTFATSLAGWAGATLVEIDDFVSWHDFAGWWPRFEAEVLTPLLAGKDARYRVRDWTNDEFGSSLNGWKTAAWSPFVVLDGVTCTRAEARGRLAYRIWIEAPEPVRLERGVVRDGEDHRGLWLDWMRRERAYFAGDGTRERADIRLDSSGGSLIRLR